MDEFYELIELKIKESGYTADVSGFYVYNEISDLIDGKENGTYILMSKPYNDVMFEYRVEVMNESFNLSYMDITTAEEQYHIDFDE